MPEFFDEPTYLPDSSALLAEVHRKARGRHARRVSLTAACVVGALALGGVALATSRQTSGGAGPGVLQIQPSVRTTPTPAPRPSNSPKPPAPAAQPSSAADNPSPSPRAVAEPATRIAFCVGGGFSASSDYCAVQRPDGSGTQVIPGAMNDAQPAWAPDGERIVFQRQTQHQTTQGLYTYSLRTGGTRLLVAMWLAENPAWSADGTRIAFDDETDIWTVRPDGTGLRRITTHKPSDYGDSQPAWSPDGKQIAFNHAGSLMLMNADGTGRRTLRAFRNGDWEYPRWSPNGRTILVSFQPTCYSNGTNCYLGDLFEVRPDGSGFHQVTTDHHRFFGTWSPSGERIVYDYGTPQVCCQIWVMNADGSHAHPLPNTQGTFTVAWHISP